MKNQNETRQIYMVCDGNPIQFKSEYSAKEICNFIGMIKGSSGIVEIKEGLYVDPSKVSIIKEKIDTEVVLKIDEEELGRVCIDAINAAQRKYNIEPVIIKC